MPEHQTEKKLKKFKPYRPHILIPGAIFVILFAIIGLHYLLASHAAPTDGPTTPPVEVCGNTSELSGPSTAPSGAVTVAAGDDSSVNFSTANTTYWFAPGVHYIGSGEYDQIDPGNNDVLEGAPGAILSGDDSSVSGYVANNSAISGNGTDVTIEYLTIEDFDPPGQQGAVNQNSSDGWTIKYDTIENNAPGAGMMIGSNNTIEYNCLTDNGQYAFNGYLVSSDPTASTVTGGPENINLSYNEISYNDTCNFDDFSPSPVPASSVQPACSGAGQFSGCGCDGGGKFWEAQNVTFDDNYVHNNYSTGVWADTDNDGFQFEGNYISNNYAEGIMYEISYNAVIENNTLIDNSWIGFDNPDFPTGAIYISESGGDSRVPNSFNYDTITISNNTFTNDWSGVVLWENSNRFCGDGSDGVCTLVDPSVATITSCPAALSNSSENQSTDTPDYFDLCRWKTQNVTVSDNVFNITPADIGSDCTEANSCGMNALFSEYGSTTPYTAWVVPLNISNNQNNVFEDNTYNGPWNFLGFNQGDNVTWSQWTSGFEDWNGSGDTFHPQDAGSTYNSTATGSSTTGGSSTGSPPVTVSPTTPTNLKATASSDTSVNLSWTASTDSGGPGLAGYYIFRDNTQLNSSPDTSTSYTDSTAKASTAYTYTVEAVDVSGNVSSQSNSVSVTTPAPTTSSGSSTSGGSGSSSGSSGSTVLNYTFAGDSTDGMSAWYDDTVAASTAKVRSGSSYSLAVTGTGGGAGIQSDWQAGSVTAGTAYNFNSWWLAGSTAEPISEQVSWIGSSGDTISTSSFGPTTDSTSSWTGLSGTATAPSGATSFWITFTYPSASGQIQYVSDITVTTSSGTSSPPVTVLPSTPTGVSATASSDSSVTVSWTASTDSGGPGIGGYYVLRSTNGEDYTTLGSSTTTSYTDSSVSASTKYYYEIEAYDTSGNVSNASSAANVTTPAAIVTTVAAPTGLAATAVSSSQINLSWSESTNGVSSYEVYRTGDASPLATVTTKSYGVTGLTADTAYSFYVVATEGSISSADSSSVSATTEAASTAKTTVEGTVRNVTGSDIDEAFIFAETPGTGVVSSSTFSNSNGQYVLSGITPSTRIEYYFSANGHKPYSTIKDYPAGTSTLNVLLRISTKG